MKQFVIKVLIVGLLLFAIDKCIGLISDKLFCNLPAGYSEASTIYRCLFDEKAEILVLGPSSATHHYNTKILSENLNASAYNTGFAGRDLIYSDLIFQTFLSRECPKYVIIDIGLSNLNGRWKDRISCVRPYYGRNKIITDYYRKETSWQQRLKLQSNIYRYNGTMHDAFNVLFGDKEIDKTNGFRPLHGCDSFEYKTEEGFEPDEDVLRHLDNIVNTCKEKGIVILLVKSPHFAQNVTFNKWLEEYGSKHGVTVILESENRFWKEHPEYFYDGSHLNSEGADIFTKNLCDILLIQQKH